MLTQVDSPPSPLAPSPAVLKWSSVVGGRSSALAFLLITALTFVMGLLAWRVSAAESVAVGTDADRIYITDGFYDPEQSAQNGIYRWSQPFAQLALPDWGPGRLHISISGVGVVTSQAVLRISGVPVDRVGITPGEPWTLQAWGISASRNPTVTVEAPLFTAPGDKRTLGLLVKTVEIYAPDARVRALIDTALVGLAGTLLFLFLYISSSGFAISTIAGLAFPALLAPFAAYRDPWMDTVAWVAPLSLAVLLALSFRRHFMPGQAPPAQGPKHSAFRIPRSAFLVLALTSALFLLYLGYMNAFDSDRMYQVTAGLAEYGRPTRYPGFSTWTKYGFGQPLIAVPFYLFGKLGILFGAAFEPITRLAISFTNLAVTALTCWLLYRAARRFASTAVALAVAATYLLTTPALNYARTFFSEPAGGLLLLTSLLLIIPRTTSDPLQPRRVLLAGICLGAMVLFKPAFAVYIPAPGLAVIWLALRGRSYQSSVDERNANHSPSSSLARLAPIALFAVGPIAGLLIQAGYDYIRYAPLPNAFLRTGYEKEPGFSTPLLEGLGGILFSPGKSIFLYAPVLLLVPLGLWLMFGRREASGRLTVLPIVAEVAAGLIFNSLWWAWTGNFAWGPRLIMPVLPLLVWPLSTVGALATRHASQYDKLRITNYELRVGGGGRGEGEVDTRRPVANYILLGLWILLAIPGAVVSIAGALVDFQVYFHAYGLQLAGDPGEAVTLYDPANSPLLVEPGYLLNGLTAAIHRPSLASTGMSPIWDALVPAALVILASVALWCGTMGEVKRKT